MTAKQRMALKDAMFTYLDVSTGNLPEEEFRAVESSLGTSHNYGAWMHVPASDDMEDCALYPNLVALLTAAREMGCRWINFDQDAPFLGEFPAFHW